MTPSIAFILVALVSPERERAVPRVLVGDALPPGAVARFGPTGFRYAGWDGKLTFSADGKRVGITAPTGVSAWDVATGKRLLWVQSDSISEARLLGFTPTGEVVVSCRRKGDDSGDGVFRLDPATGKVTARFQPEDRAFTAVSPDGTVAYSRTRVNAYRDSTVATDIATGKELWRRKHPEMSWILVSPDGSRLVTWSARVAAPVEVLDAATGKTVETFAQSDRDNYPYGGLAVGPKASRVLVGHSWADGFSVFEAGTEKPVSHVSGTWYTHTAISHDGRTAVFGRGRGGETLEVWDAVEKKLRASVPVPQFHSLALSPDGATVAVTFRTPGNTVALLDVATGKPRTGTPEPFTQAGVVWYLPDGTLASADGKFERPVKWDAKTGAMAPLPAGTKPPALAKLPTGFQPPVGTQEVTASPDGTRVVGHRVDPDDLDSAPGDNYIGLFDATGKVLAQYERPDNTGGARWAFSADGKTFAIARGDGTITFYASDTGKQLGTVRHAGGVPSLAFSPDGKHLATACGDGPVLVWDVRVAKPAK